MSVNSKMKAIADAIRAKTGGTSALTLDGMAEAVAGIEAGGGGGFPNGTEWTQSNVASDYFMGLKSANGVWVAGGYSTGLWYSTDGMTWTQSNVSAGKYMCIENANGIWVASSDTANVHYSTDGMTWTQSSSTLKARVILYADIGTWVAVNYSNGYAYYSTDGMVWTSSQTRVGGESDLCYANGIFVAVGETAYYSTDGVSWDAGGKSPSSIYTFNAIRNANGIFVGAAGSGGLWYSTDGMTWTQSNIDRGGYNRLVYGNGLWVAGGKGTACYSADGMTWIQVSVVYSSGDYRCLGYSNGVYVFSTYNGGVHYSTDGMTWTKSNITSGTAYQAINDNGVWVLGTDKGLWYSPTWLPSN